MQGPKFVEIPHFLGPKITKYDQKWSKGSFTYYVTLQGAGVWARVTTYSEQMGICMVLRYEGGRLVK
jgi:hypothetical protein